MKNKFAQQYLPNWEKKRRYESLVTLKKILPSLLTAICLNFIQVNCLSQTISVNFNGLYLNEKLISKYTPIDAITSLLNEKPRKSEDKYGQIIFTYDRLGIAIKQNKETKNINSIHLSFLTRDEAIEEE